MTMKAVDEPRHGHVQGSETSPGQSTTALMSLVPVMEGQLAPTTRICEYTPPSALPC